MGSQDTVTERDLRRLLGLADAATSAADGHFPIDVLAGLREIIPCNDVSFLLMDGRRRKQWGTCVDDVEALAFCEDESEDSEEYQLFWSAFWAYGGCSYPQETGDYASVLRRSDRFGDREYDTTAMGQVMRRAGVRHEVLAPLPPQGCLDRRLLLFRDEGSDFTEREVLLLRILRPHLNEIHLRQQRRMRGQPELTHRQWEILRLVATGAGNAQVARALCVSQATVRKHLEHIFQRLDAGSRTEAVARVAPFLDVAPTIPRQRSRLDAPRARQVVTASQG